jgi:hypothetical protein
MRFVNRVWPRVTVTNKAIVTDKREENGTYIISADFCAENQHGDRTIEDSMRAALPKRRSRPPVTSEADTAYPKNPGRPPQKAAHDPPGQSVP